MNGVTAIVVVSLLLVIVVASLAVQFLQRQLMREQHRALVKATETLQQATRVVNAQSDEIVRLRNQINPRAGYSVHVDLLEAGHGS